MKWCKEIEILPLAKQYSREEHIVLWGSCFAQELYLHLYQHLYQVHFSPYGIMYNPLSMARGLQQLLDGQSVEEHELYQHQGLWHSAMHHGSYSATTKEVTLAHIHRDFQSQRELIPHTKLWVFTFGTAYLYQWATPPHDIVNNCHKLPASSYTRRRASVDEIIQAWEPILDQLTTHDSQVVFTVSPIPHYRDGAHESRVSKAALLLAIEELTQHPCVHYFPSYEIQLDELRDYRFFKEDMAHPTAQAVSYILKRFAEYALQPLDPLGKKWEKLLPQLQHRPINEADQHEYFARLIAELQALQEHIPHPYLTSQIHLLEQKLKS